MLNRQGETEGPGERIENAFLSSTGGRISALHGRWVARRPAARAGEPAGFLFHSDSRLRIFQDAGGAYFSQEAARARPVRFVPCGEQRAVARRAALARGDVLERRRVPQEF